MTNKSSEPSRSARFPWRDGHPPHLPVGPGQVPRIVLLPGDPGRVDLAAKVMRSFRILGQNREFRFGVGLWAGEEVGVCSTGIGGPSTEIAMVELANVGMEVAIRVGGMGAINPAIGLGELLVVREALRGSGAAAFYARPDERVLADPRVVEALQFKTQEMNLRSRIGIVATVDSYYAGQGRPYRAGGSWVDNTAAWAARGADGLEMETETVLAVARELGVAAGAVLGAHNSRSTDVWLEDYAQTQLDVLRAGAAAGVHVLRQIDMAHARSAAGSILSQKPEGPSP